ncbi:AAA family ATPase [Saccharopolyspora sp. ASAGF58]|uniref:AAA family ATPase n=1 Tax=Saccharopolyspora sp. ASAGF58 TaxID=2719023 RepID=UPI001446166F|nr:AAA family ATPase [Saccharopolyspora sp. ASAGF58]
MILHSLTLTNFRGVTHRTVQFADTGVTIVEGPNEVGKSSLAEALDLVLGELDSSTKRALRAVKPHHRDVSPEVEAQITSGTYRFTIRKRWFHGAKTELTVHTPRAEQLTGRAAHDRMTEILTETHDWNLWEALRINQRAPLREADFTTARGLAHALDQAASGSSDHDNSQLEESLYDSSRKEMLRYFTEKKAVPAGDYKQAVDVLKQAEATERQVADVIDDIRIDTERAAEVECQLHDLRTQQAERNTLAQELHTQQTKVDRAQREVDALGMHVDTASIEAQATQAALASREKLISDLDERAQHLSELATDREALAARHDTALTTATNARTAREAADRAVNAAEEQERRAAAAKDHAVDVDALDGLTRHAQQIRETQAIAQECAVWLDGCQLTKSMMSKLRKAHDELTQAAAAANAAAARLTLTAIADTQVDIDDQRRDLGRGEEHTHVLTGDTDITVANQLRLRLTPGLGEREGAEILRAARDNWNRLRREAGVETIADAEDLNGQRQAREAQAKSAKKTLNSLYSFRSADDTEDEITRVRARIKRYTDTSNEPGHPCDLNEARRQHEHVVAAVKNAKHRARLAQTRLAKCEKDLAALRAEQTALDSRITTFNEEINAAQGRLAHDRSVEDDHALRKRADEARDNLADFKQQHRRAIAELDQLGGPQLAARLDAIKSAIESLDKEIKELDAEGHEIRGRLSDPRVRGLAERLADAQREHAEARAHHDTQRRRAHAAKLLFDTLHSARERAHEHYRTPFRARIEDLGRVLFGNDFAVDLDTDLAITTRTLNGITVPYTSLSGGTQEQLCVLTRLACATLVDPSAGVPALFDDTLGHSDPERLDLLAAVMSTAAAKCQVILFTCMPTRFRGIRGAHRVRLQAPTPEHPETPESRPLQTIDRNRPHTDDSPEQRIIECLRTAAGPLARQDILDHTGLTSAQWQTAIAVLKQDGRVLVTGKKRGTRYSLPPTSEDA